MTFRLVALTATAFACLSSAHAQQRELVTARVSYAGLDLAKTEDRRILDARIYRAALRVCHSQAIGFQRAADERRCRNEMRSDAQIRLAQLTPVMVATTR